MAAFSDFHFTITVKLGQYSIQIIHKTCLTFLTFHPFGKLWSHLVVIKGSKVSALLIFMKFHISEDGNFLTSLV